MIKPGHCLSFALLFSLLLSACQGIVAADAAPSTKIEAAAVAIATPNSNTTPPSPNVETVWQELEIEEPLKFTFPTPADPPVSLWRPPLYEVPWAVNPHDHFYFIRPIAADEVNWPLADYRYGYYFTGTNIVHTGIDIDAKRGTPVIAAADGTVVWSGIGLYKGPDSPDDPYGIAVAIRHNFGFDRRQLYTIYAHMDRADVSVGQTVKAGDQLGIVGNTGFTTGPHLHFEVRLERNSYYVSRNPELWLAPPQGWGVLVGRWMKADGSLIRLLDVRVSSSELKRSWVVRTYAPESVNSDDYYRENLVLSDLPAGEYNLQFSYNGSDYQTPFRINPGAITYLTFREGYGFSNHLPNSSLDTPVWQPVEP